jgi:pyruvate, water dikinase
VRDWCRWLTEVDAGEVAVVGGKNASLGEMLGNLARLDIRVPDGFATTADAYREFVAANGLDDIVREQIRRLDDGAPVHEVGGAIRARFRDATVPEDLADAIGHCYDELSRRTPGRRGPASVAVRSSATAEDLPDASFAGQQETYLNVRGTGDLLDACARCFASLFTDRAIAYREERGYDHLEVALSVGVQLMVRSDLAGAGVMFTCDPETGFPGVVVIDAAFGLGEGVVSGTVDPDEYLVSKPLLAVEGVRPVLSHRRGAKAHRIVHSEDGAAEPTCREATPPEDQARFVLDDDEILTLARQAVAIEAHYGRAMDIEWAKDGCTGELFIVQARPETVQSQAAAGLRTYTLRERVEPLVSGGAIGQAIAAGPACVLGSPETGPTSRRAPCS